MMEMTIGRRAAAATAVRVLLVAEAVAFVVAAPTHLGLRLAVGGAVLAEPRILPAAIVEGLSGLFCAASAYAVFTRTRGAWQAAIAAHTFALLGVLLGIVTLAAGFGPRTELNTIFHRVMLLVLVVGLALLYAPITQAALGRGPRAAAEADGGAP